jgi:hypothetical protein
MSLEAQSIREIAAAIQPDKLPASFPRPQRVSIIEGQNSERETALYVYLVFPNSTPDSILAWKKIEPMVRWVHDYVWNHTGQSAWPYVKVKKEEELPPELAHA